MDLLFELSRPYREVLFFARLSILGKGVLPLAQQLHKNGIARVLYYKSTNSMKFCIPQLQLEDIALRKERK